MRAAVLVGLVALGACAPTHYVRVDDLARQETVVPALRASGDTPVFLRRESFAVSSRAAAPGYVAVGRRGTHHPAWKAGTALWVIGAAAAALGIGFLAQPSCECGGLAVVGLGLGVPGIIMVAVGVPLMAGGGAAQPREVPASQ